MQKFKVGSTFMIVTPEYVYTVQVLQVKTRNAGDVSGCSCQQSGCCSDGDTNNVNVNCCKGSKAETETATEIQVTATDEVKRHGS